MIFALFGSALLLAIVVLFIKKDVFHPAFLISVCYAFSAFFVAADYSKVGDISFSTFIIVFGSLVLFSIPCLLFSSSNKKEKDIKEYSPIIIPVSIKIIFVLFIVLIDYLYFRHILNLAIMGGYTGGIKNIFTYAQRAMYDPAFDSSMSPFLNYGLKIARALGFIIAFELVQMVVFWKKYQRNIPSFLLSIAGVLLFLVQCLLSTGRTQIFYYLIFMLTIYIFLYREKIKWSKNCNWKFVRLILVTSVIGLVAFRLVGVFFRGSIYGNESSVWENLSKYIGGPIIGLDRYLANPTYASYFGEETLYSLYSILDKLGLNTSPGATYLEFITYWYGDHNVSVNVYGAIRRYIHDYSYFTIAILVLEGIFYGAMYKKIQTKGCRTFLFIFYAKSIFPVIFFFFEERLLIDVLTVSNALTLIIMYILYRCFKQTKPKLRRSSYLSMSPNKTETKTISDVNA